VTNRRSKESNISGDDEEKMDVDEIGNVHKEGKGGKKKSGTSEGKVRKPNNTVHRRSDEGVM
jgi:hypothetical protein